VTTLRGFLLIRYLAAFDRYMKNPTDENERVLVDARATWRVEGEREDAQRRMEA
jgi:hypothetical protein